jgi:hypothetical protein
MVAHGICQMMVACVGALVVYAYYIQALEGHQMRTVYAWEALTYI